MATTSPTEATTANGTECTTPFSLFNRRKSSRLKVAVAKQFSSSCLSDAG